MAPRAARTKESAFEAFDNGAQPKELVKQGYTRTAAYKWFKQWQLDRVIDPVEEAEEPARVAAPTDPVSTTTRKKTPITEETAGMILATLFNIWASVTHEELRVLTASQRARLQGPFAQTLQTIPNPVAELINTYAAPVGFVTTLVAVVQEQNDLITRKNAAAYNELAQRQRAAEEARARHAHVHSNGVAVDAPAVQADAAVPEDMRTSTGVAEPETQTQYFN